MSLPDSVVRQARQLFPELSGLDKPSQAANLSPWSNAETHPFFFAIVLNHKFGAEWVFFEPETVLQYIEKFKASDEIGNEILCVKSCLHADSAWNDIGAFNNVIISFSGSIPKTDLLEHVFPHEVHFAKDVMKRIDEDREWSPDVLGYADAVNRMHAGFEGSGKQYTEHRVKRVPRDLAYHFGERP